MAPCGKRGYSHERGIAMTQSKIEGRVSKLEDRGSEIDAIHDPRVALTSLQSPAYKEETSTGGEIGRALERIAKELRWSEEERGPFGRMIPRGARVLIKPNLVLHQNEGPWGIDPLVTH